MKLLAFPHSRCLISLPNTSSLQGRSQETLKVLQPCAVCLGRKMWQKTFVRNICFYHHSSQYTQGGNCGALKFFPIVHS